MSKTLETFITCDSIYLKIYINNSHPFLFALNLLSSCPHTDNYLHIFNEYFINIIIFQCYSILVIQHVNNFFSVFQQK